MPRWFTEGLAVHEETQVSPEWGDRVSPEVLVAIRDKKLLPVAKLDRGFIFPEYPAQVIVSYFQAGSICDYIQSRWGEDKLLDMVHSYAQRKTTPEVIQEILAFRRKSSISSTLQWLEQSYGTRRRTSMSGAKRWRAGRGGQTEAVRRCDTAGRKRSSACIPSMSGTRTRMSLLL